MVIFIFLVFGAPAGVGVEAVETRALGGTGSLTFCFLLLPMIDTPSRCLISSASRSHSSVLTGLWYSMLMSASPFVVVRKFTWKSFRRITRDLPSSTEEGRMRAR